MIDDPAYVEWRRRVVPELSGALVEARAMLDAFTLDDAFLVEFAHKTRKGWAEHDGGIRFMSREQVQAMAREEVIDLLAYIAHIRAARA